MKIEGFTINKNEVSTFNQVEEFYENNGIEKTLKEFGYFITTQGVLNSSFRKKWSVVKSKNISIFISYSWYSGHLLQWVDNFAKLLKENEFNVYFDKDFLPKDFDPLNLPLVADFISNIFISDYFIRIIDKTYIDNAQARKNKTTFVFDENHRAMHLKVYCNHPIKLVNVILEDEPDPHLLSNDIYVDLRNNIQNIEPLIRFLEYIKVQHGK